MKGGRTITDFVSLTDLAPTFLEAAGLKPPGERTGRSLMPLLVSGKFGLIEPARAFTITGMERHVYAYPCRAIRAEGFLYIRNFGSAKWPTGEGATLEPKIDYTDGSWPKHDGAFSFNIDFSPNENCIFPWSLGAIRLGI